MPWWLVDKLLSLNSMLWAHFDSWCHIKRHAHLAGKHSSQVHICAMEYWQLVTTCTYANLSRINAHHRTRLLFGLWQQTTSGLLLFLISFQIWTMAGIHDVYQTPLNSRYSSQAMKSNFSDQKKFSTWRQLWVWLARAESQLGVKTDGEHEISEEQVCQAGFTYTNVKILLP